MTGRVRPVAGGPGRACGPRGTRRRPSPRCCPSPRWRRREIRCRRTLRRVPPHPTAVPGRAAPWPAGASAATPTRSHRTRPPVPLQPQRGHPVLLRGEEPDRREPRRQRRPGSDGKSFPRSPTSAGRTPRTSTWPSTSARPASTGTRGRRSRRATATGPGSSGTPDRRETTPEALGRSADSPPRRPDAGESARTFPNPT